MNKGWWRLEIDVRMNGIKVDFDEDLSAEAKRKIMKMIADGCVAGEVEESEDLKPMACEEV